MLKLDKQIRFTPAEISEAMGLGINLADVKTEAQFSEALVDLIRTLEHERPALLDKIAKILVEEAGLRLPPKLRVITSNLDPLVCDTV